MSRETPFLSFHFTICSAPDTTLEYLTPVYYESRWNGGMVFWRSDDEKVSRLTTILVQVSVVDYHQRRSGSFVVCVVAMAFVFRTLS